MIRSITLVAALWISASGLALAQDKATIQSLDDQLASALNSGDAAAAAALYAEDAHLLPPGSPAIRGRQAIQEFWAAGTQTFENLKLTTEDVKPLGDSAAPAIGSFGLRTKGDQPQEIAGKYVVIWEKSRDTWQISTDIWNLNQ